MEPEDRVRSLLPLARSRLAMGGGRVLLRARGGGSLREVMAEPGSPETPVTAAVWFLPFFRGRPIVGVRRVGLPREA